MTIRIEHLHFDTIIGILEAERHTPQRVIVTCNIEYAYQEEAFINYADVIETIEATMKRERFKLIEDAIAHLSTLLKSRFPSIQQLELHIQKPDIIPHATVGISEKFYFDA